jgi:hypothetical protein
VLVTNAVSVDQWTYQFKLWTTIQDENLGRFTSSNKSWFTGDAGVMVCTYSMIAGTFKRAADSQRVFDAIVGREWGLILLDEVHVVPAEMFRYVPSHIHSTSAASSTPNLSPWHLCLRFVQVCLLLFVSDSSMTLAACIPRASHNCAFIALSSARQLPGSLSANSLHASNIMQRGGTMWSVLPGERMQPCN